MPRIPGLPTLDPTSQPEMSPAEAGRPGESIAQSGEVANDLTIQQQDLGLFMKKAQEHVDVISAQNQLAAVYAETKEQLAKTQNSRDVPDVIAQANKNLNGLSAEWSKSPASVAIQMQADGLRPDLAEVGTMRQITLMSNEFKISLNTQGELLAGEYAASRGMGDTEKSDAVLGNFTQKVMDGVKTGLVGDVEAQEYIRQFRQKGQELQIKNAITNANPEVNQKIADDITAHREMFPDVTQEALDTYKGQALSAVESHIKYQNWAEGQMAEKTMLAPLIQQFTNPATGQFEEDKALTDIATRFSNGKLTVTQRDVLSEGVKAQTSDLKVGVDKEAGKRKDDIVKLFDGHDYKQGYAQLEANRPWFEDNGHSDLYEGLHKYGEQQQREQRVEAREEYALEKQVESERSSETLGNLLSAMSQGHVFTDAQLYGMAGQGTGKMKSSDVMESIRASKAYEGDPSTQAAVKLMADSFPLTTVSRTATPEEVAAAATPNARQSKRMALTYEQWQQRVNQNPNEDKVKAMQDVLQPAIQQDISEKVTAIFGAETSPSAFNFRVPGGTFTFGQGVVLDKSPKKSIPPGTIRVKEKSTGRTGTIPASEYDEKVYEKVQ